MKKRKVYNKYKILIVSSAIMLQLLFFLTMIVFLRDYSNLFYFLGILISVVALLYIIYNNSNPSFKIAWIIPITLVPVLGGVMYLALGINWTNRRDSKKYKAIEDATSDNLEKNNEVLDLLSKRKKSAAVQSKYIQDNALYPPAINSNLKYFALGENNFESLKEELLKAKHFIFMEYFIIEEGKMWNEILEILEAKSKEGVDVRIIYDDFGCIMKLPANYDKYLNEKGIACQIFNPIGMRFTNIYNTRDHRKITVIDNKVAFTGGINLADEYINEFERFGHWKDGGIKVQGDAVWSFTVMFLNMWDALSNTKSDYSQFKRKPDTHFTNNGIVQPYSDTPLDGETVGQNVYLNLINKAEDYVYITTPYLIIDSEMMNALINAAKAGIDVRIITPHIADKWYVHEVTRGTYMRLIDNGVKVFEYEPGFIHSKNFVVDDNYSVVGTINMDYRSLFLHFECGVWTFQSGIEQDVKKDFLDTQEKSIEITMQDFENYGVIRTLVNLVLGLFAPLM